jgi:3-oxoacyl-[acyl-carrier-protein] synthase II
MRRVVVTGLGAITPLGVGVRHTWSRLLAGESGLASLANLEPRRRWKDLTSTVAGLVPSSDSGDGQWRASDWLGESEQRRTSKFTQYAVAAAEMALRDAGWRPSELEDQEMTGVCLGSGIGNLEEIYGTSIAFEQYVREIGQLMIRRDLLRYHGRVIRKCLRCLSRRFSSIWRLVTSP